MYSCAGVSSCESTSSRHFVCDTLWMIIDVYFRVATSSSCLGTSLFIIMDLSAQRNGTVGFFYMLKVLP